MSSIYRLLYDVLFLCGGLLYFFKYLLRGRIRREFFKRCGFFVKDDFLKLSHAENSIWIHAVSVGEVALVRGFLPIIHQKFPNVPVVLSVITPSGYEAAQVFLRNHVAHVFFAPIDLSFVTKKMVHAVKPKIFIAIETELWPMLYYQLWKMKVPIIILNGRISDKSFRRYQKLRFVLHFLFRWITLIAAQDSLAHERFLALGASDRKTKTVGNLKYLAVTCSEERIAEVTKHWRFISGIESYQVILAASTHFPEEKFVFEAFQKVRERFPKVVLLLCPRHRERAQEVFKESLACGFSCERFSTLTTQRKEVYILDTIGDLFYSYSFSDVVFLGGSLVPAGGHNIIEPAYFAKPVIVGPHTYNFSEIVNTFISEKALLKIDGPEQLPEAFLLMLENSQLAHELGTRAHEVVRKKQDSLRRNIETVFDEK